MKTDLRDLSYQETEHYLSSIKEPKYRAQQIFNWLYQKLACSYADMKNIPADLKEKIEEKYALYNPEIKQKQKSKIDGTEKYLLELADGEFIETVIIPSGERVTICLSTQVGCRYKCKFCASGLYGFKRNLNQSEILSQLITVQKDGFKPTNIVFMGIGEPLDNYENLVRSIKIINDKNAFNIGARRITISTSGIPDKIRRLAGIGLQIELSLSLHAPDNNKRDILMPINRIYPVKNVLESLREYYERTKRLITFEYVLIKDINDSEEDAHNLVNLLNDMKCKINLIPFSPVKEFSYQRPKDSNIMKFSEILEIAHIPATIRSSKGADISAACGQLRIKHMAENSFRPCED